MVFQQSMKAFKLTTAISILLSTQLFGSLISFSDVYVSVDTNDFLNRPDKKTALCVKVNLSSYKERANVATGIHVDCYEFDSGFCGFDDRDREFFIQTAAAAKENRKFAADVVSPAIRPRQIETHFESKQIDGRYFVTVRRGEQTAKFEPEEGERLVNALRDAKAAESWYQSLLNEDTLPQPSEDKHPPHAKGYYVISRIGEVDLHGFMYEVSLDCNSFRGSIDYRTGHTIRFGKNGETTGTMGGDWSQLLQHISEALQSLKKNDDYDFIADDRKYHIQANRETGQVDVTVALSDFFPDRTPIVGHVSGGQLQAINDLIDEVPAREKWFKHHEAWFFTASE
jgi:hypothetical protein